MSARLTDDELRAMLASATDGDWAVEGEHVVARRPGSRNAIAVTRPFREDDARLIAAAPDLAREVLELRAKVRDYEAPLPVGDLKWLTWQMDPQRMQGRAIPAAAVHAAIDLRQAYAPGVRVVAAAPLPAAGVAEGDMGAVHSWHGDEVTVRYMKAGGIAVTYSAHEVGTAVRLYDAPRENRTHPLITVKFSDGAEAMHTPDGTLIASKGSDRET